MRLLPFLFLLLPLVSSAQTSSDTLRFRVMSYNVENLFDHEDDTLKEDAEFLPEGVRHWTYKKYRKKLDDVARVIIAVGEWTPPALVALCEVENDSVLRDLTRYSVLREAEYRYIVTESPDERGIDVALLYQRGLFKPIATQSLGIEPPDRDSRPTRDILHVSGQLLNRDTLDVFVCHFPSRSGGTKATEPYRLAAARRLRSATDSLTALRQRPQILIMGDLNDYPDNHSLQAILRRDAPLPLYHLLAQRVATEKQSGSYKYQGEWGLFDHLIVSENLLQPDAPLHTDATQADVFRAPFLLTDDNKYGGKQPFSTYYGRRYQGGYSDHLPVWAEFRLIY